MVTVVSWRTASLPYLVATAEGIGRGEAVGGLRDHLDVLAGVDQNPKGGPQQGLGALPHADDTEPVAGSRWRRGGATVVADREGQPVSGVREPCLRRDGRGV